MFSVAEVWNMSLRNAWERVVPLGSLFSGLTVTIRTTPPYTDKRASREDAAEKLQQKARYAGPKRSYTLRTEQ